MTLTGVYYAWKKGELLLGIKYCEDSFRESENINDIGLMASTGGYLCLLYWWKGECHKSVDVAPKVIAMLDKTQRQAEFFGRPTNLYSVIHAWYAECMAMLGNFEEAKALLNKSLDFAHKLKDLRALSIIELHNGWVRNFRGEGKKAIAHLQNCIKYCEKGFTHLFGVTWGNLGWAYFLLGDLKSALEYTEKGLEFHSGAENQTDMGLFYWLLGMIYLESGDLENAQNRAEKALILSQNMHQKWIESFVWILLGRISGKAEKSHIEKAEESILKGIKILNELKLKALYAPGYHYLGVLYADTGQKDRALGTLKKAEMMFQEMGMDYWLAKTQEVLRPLNG
jgi:tetratricopeptide (TPR) repeat protein